MRSFRISDLQRLVFLLAFVDVSDQMGLNLLRNLWRAGGLWEWYIVPKDIGKSSIPVLAFEWSSPEKHLIYQNTQSPPVNGARVAAAFDDFGGDVLLGSDK